jgi:hypothetical protein
LASPAHSSHYLPHDVTNSQVNITHAQFSYSQQVTPELRMSIHQSESRYNNNLEEGEEESYVSNRRRAREPTRMPRIPPLEILQKRRLAANARERKRMNKINTAFERLKRVLPGLENKELSKFESLQLAQDYILHLARILQDSSA